MADIDSIIEEDRRKRQKEYDDFMETCKNKITDGGLIYRSLALFIAKRFQVKISPYAHCDLPDCVYHILNYYVEEVDEDFEKWLNKNDAPLIRPKHQLRKIFHEFDFISDDKKLVDTVNKVYGLDLNLDSDYIYTNSFDFNSFVPINVEEIHNIKEDINTLRKYNYPTIELEEKLKDFNLPDEIIEVI